jgi:selenocysteine lyase/cysteine desulfurase
MLTSSAPAMSCGIGTFAIEGTDHAALARSLWDRRILVAPILHEEFQGIRVTPGLYTTIGEIDAFSDEIVRRVETADLPAFPS